MSRKRTATADKNIPTPIEKTITYNIGIGIKNIVRWSGVPVTMNTIKNARNEKPRLTNEESTLVAGKMYFGTYTFFIVSAP